MIFTAPLLNLYIKRGIIDGFSATWACTIFRGTQPTAAQVTSSWSTYSADYMVHWTGISWTHPNANTYGSGNLCQMTAIPTAVVANKGSPNDATYAILWASNVTEATVQGATLPNTAFIIGPVTSTAGNGMVRLSNISITAGISYQPSAILISLGGLV